MNLIHEYGHGMVCLAEENEFKIGLSLSGGSLVCIGNLKNQYLFYASGGLFATLVSLTPFIKKQWVINRKWPAVVSLSFAISNAINALFETFFHDWYINESAQSAMVMGVLSLVVFGILIFKFGEKE